MPEPKNGILYNVFDFFRQSNLIAYFKMKKDIRMNTACGILLYVFQCMCQKVVNSCCQYLKKSVYLLLLQKVHVMSL